jgi:hypothetical protein
MFEGGRAGFACVNRTRSKKALRPTTSYQPSRARSMVFPRFSHRQFARGALIRSSMYESGVRDGMPRVAPPRDRFSRSAACANAAAGLRSGRCHAPPTNPMLRRPPMPLVRRPQCAWQRVHSDAPTLCFATDDFCSFSRHLHGSVPANAPTHHVDCHNPFNRLCHSPSPIQYDVCHATAMRSCLRRRPHLSWMLAPGDQHPGSRTLRTHAFAHLTLR